MRPRIKYFYSSTNLIDISGICANYVIVFNEIFGREFFSNDFKTYLIVLAVFCLWFRAFYWMRVFERPALLILLIRRTLTHILPFMVLLFIILLLFTNMLYVLNKTQDPLIPRYETSLYSEESKYSFYSALIHIYLISLGEFNMDDYENRGETIKQIILLGFILATFLIQITFMNMLIAIMGEIFGEVTSKGK